MFFTENKNTDADTDTRKVSQAVSRTQAVSTGAVERRVSSPVDGGVSWKEREQQYETGVSYPTEVVVNSNRPRVFIYRLTSINTESAASKYQF